MPGEEPVPIKFPLSSFPGASTQESAGRLVNCFAEPLGDGQHPTGPNDAVWRASPGLSQHNSMPTGQTGYRGGLIVGGLSYEVWSGNLSTVDNLGNITSLGTINGTKKVSIAHNQIPTPNVIIVDIDNGAFQTTGGAAPTAYTAGGILIAQPNSVCFQDGYFFFTIGAGQCYATQINSLTMNALTFATAQTKSDVTLLRGIAYSGYLFLFTTGGMEIWADTAQPFPNFPYTRSTALPTGLIQANAIAGWETGFDDMMWVAQDYGVYRLPWGNYTPQKISSADVDRFVEAQVTAGNTLEAGVYAFAGKKFWTITSNAALTTWEFNVVSQQWNERQSLLPATGAYARWRGTGGHLAFNRWLMGDTQSGNLLFVDDTNYTENGAPQLMRIESGPVEGFPRQIRIARADFNFVTGVGQVVGHTTLTVLGTGVGAATPSGNLVRLTVNNTAQVRTGDQLNVSGVGGTTEANGTWMCTVIDGFHIDLINTLFVNAWTSGGTVVDVTVPPNVTTPTVAVSVSKDGGIGWGNPLFRSLGPQQKSSRVRISVKSMGLSGPMGVRWRLDASVSVYRAFIKGTMASDPREVGL